MIEIGDIKTTKKGRYALFCADEFLFSIDEATFLEWKLAIGSTLTDEQLLRLKDASDSRRAVDKAMDYLAYRSHSSGELRQKLLKNFDADTSEYAVAYLTRLGYVDDAAFAADYARELIETRRCSLAQARAKLNEKRVSRELIEDALLPYAESEAQSLQKLIAAKYAGKPKEKVFAALARRGFRQSEIRRALCSAEDEFYYE